MSEPRGLRPPPLGRAGDPFDQHLRAFKTLGPSPFEILALVLPTHCELWSLFKFSYLLIRWANVLVLDLQVVMSTKLLE